MHPTVKAREQLAAFKCPRYLEQVNEFPYTPSQKTAKHVLISGRKDLRENNYDIQEEADNE